jgi:hypothetical protein
MTKTILTISGSALIALATIQFAAATEPQGRTHHRSTVGVQFRNSNASAAPAYVAAQPDLAGYRINGGNSAPAGH